MQSRDAFTMPQAQNVQAPLDYGCKAICITYYSILQT